MMWMDVGNNRNEMWINGGNNRNDMDQWWEQPYIMMWIIYMGNVGYVLEQELVELRSHPMDGRTDGRTDGWMDGWNGGDTINSLSKKICCFSCAKFLCEIRY